MSIKAGQDKFLGALMGMAIGDALGMPVEGWSLELIRERYGAVDAYFPRTFPDGQEVKAGEFTDETEIALCIVESLTAGGGELDVDSIGARMLHLAQGASRRWLAEPTLLALDASAETLDFRQPLSDDAPDSPDVLARGIPIGLFHSVGSIDPQRMMRDAEAVTRITHGSPLAIAGVAAVAHLVRQAARGERPPAEWAGATAEFLGQGAVAEALSGAGGSSAISAVRSSGGLPDVVATATESAASTPDFSAAVTAAVNLGGPTDTRGAVAGAIAGAHWGIAGVPQSLIDGLEGRIYVSLAAPWFYRVAMRRMGQTLPLRPD